MYRLTTTFLIVVLFLSTAIHAQHTIIPAPRSYEATEGELVIENNLEILLLSDNDQIKEQVALFGTQMKGSGIKMSVVATEDAGSKTFRHQDNPYLLPRAF